MTIKHEYQRYNPYILTFFVSLFFSYLAISTDNLINHDAVFFMDASKTVLRDGIIASFNSYTWPFYSWLVALVHKVLFFSQIEQTAHFINALFISLSCMLFIRIYAEITNHKGSMWVAAILILAFGGINSFRADIMRDIPYWFFFLAGFFCLLRYYKSPRWTTGVGWQLFVALAFLARVEGLIIILLGPLALFLKHAPMKQRIIQAGALYGLYAVGLIVAAAILVALDISYLDIPVGKLKKTLHFILGDGVFGLYDNAVRNVGELYKYEGLHIDKNYWVLAVIHASGLLAYVSVRVLGCLGFFYSAIFAYGVFKRQIQISEYNRIILYFVAFLFLFFCVYMLKGPVLTPRYTTSLVFMLLLLTGQIVEQLLPAISTSRHRRKIVSVIFLYLFLTTADSLITTQGDSKDYVLQAGSWVRENVDNSTPVYSNYFKALYYTDRGRSRKDSMRFKKLVKGINHGTLAKGAYIIVNIEQDQDKNHAEILDGLVADKTIEYVITFANDEDDKLVIYRLSTVTP